MTKYYTAIYTGDGKCFNLVAIFQPEASDLCIATLIKQLRNGSWAVVQVDSDTATPRPILNLAYYENH